MNQWRNFKGTDWQDRLDVKLFIHQNYTPYEGDASFLAGATQRTKDLNAKYDALRAEELKKGGVLDVDTKTVSTIAGFKPGYLDKDNEIIVGLQTDAPLKRAINPFGGIRMATQACKEYGYEVDQSIYDAFKYHKTHNDGVFSCYSAEMRKARHAHILTGLPDAYGRGRLIGDYRRVALYGVDAIIERKKLDKTNLQTLDMSEQVVRKIEEVQDQINALNDLKKMAADYGYDISAPANNAKEAVQWTYFAYLAAIKEQNVTRQNKHIL